MMLSLPRPLRTLNGTTAMTLPTAAMADRSPGSGFTRIKDDHRKGVRRACQAPAAAVMLPKQATWHSRLSFVTTTGADGRQVT